MIGYRYHGKKHINPSKYLLYSVEPSFKFFLFLWRQSHSSLIRTVAYLFNDNIGEKMEAYVYNH